MVLLLLKFLMNLKKMKKENLNHSVLQVKSIYSFRLNRAESELTNVLIYLLMYNLFCKIIKILAEHSVSV